MSWIPVVATALGAVIGLGAGLLIDQVRSRREDTQKCREGLVTVIDNTFATPARSAAWSSPPPCPTRSRPLPSDSVAFGDIIPVIRDKFGLDEVILVGDRGSVTKVRIGQLKAPAALVWS
jgi:hypothetical protein